MLSLADIPGSVVLPTAYCLLPTALWHTTTTTITTIITAMPATGGG